MDRLYSFGLALGLRMDVPAIRAFALMLMGRARPDFSARVGAVNRSPFTPSGIKSMS